MTDRILVGNITHLTDARYYAAREVFAIGFRYDAPDDARLEAIKEIIGWVEGPKMLLDLRDYPSEPWPDLSDFDGAIIRDMSWRDDKLFISTHPFYNGPKIITATDDFTDQDMCFLPLEHFTFPADATRLLSSPHLAIYMEGEAEEAVGLKDYGDRDDVMDYLQWDVW